MEPIDKSARYTGSLLGLAVGDALGAALEFRPKGTFEPISTMVGGGPWNLQPGEWTDDTSMALCLAASLTEVGFDLTDQIKRYVRWWREGYMSSIGYCFDIGGTTRSALENFVATGDPQAGLNAPSSAGNGSLMRLAPVPLYFAHAPKDAVEKSGESSLTTHKVAAAVDACRYFGGLICGAVGGECKDRLLSPAYSPLPEGWAEAPLSKEINEVAEGSFKHKGEEEIRGTGHVVRSLEAALWAFYRHDTFREGALAAVNLGDDADTTGAIYGQLAGAYYGAGGIPEEWANKIAKRDTITKLAEALYEKAEARSSRPRQKRLGKRD